MTKIQLWTLALSAASILLLSPEAESAIATLTPTDDAGVWNWYPAGTIDNEYLWLMAGERLDDPGTYDIARAYLKFDLSCIPDSSRIIDAELRLYAMLNRGGTVNFWHASSDAWAERGGTSITWNTQPAVDGFLAQLEVLDTSSSLKYIDLTNMWDPTIDLIDDYLSIAITMGDEFPGETIQAEFVSKDFLSYPYYQPLLTIEFEEAVPTPLPAAAWLFGWGLLGIAAYRRLSN